MDSEEDGVLKGVKLEKLLATASSIGDVGTIRSKLHERRAQLNSEIIVENRIRQGSKKLAKMSLLDDKTRDLAKLELNFSTSKIQVLQAELARINSSLQAYQPASVRGSQTPLIPLAFKTTADHDFSVFISDVISSHYHSDALAFEESFSKLQDIRKSIATPTKDQQGIDLLYEYSSHLIVVIKRFLRPNATPGCPFVWHDAVNGIPAGQRSTTYEKACVIFNIAALHSQISAQQDRGSVAGVNKAISHLEYAIGVFEYMKHNFSHSPTMDMSSEVLSLLSDLMRAQVVELQWERIVLSGLDEGNTVCLSEYSQMNKLIAECYKPVRDLVEDATLKNYLPSCWCALVKIKDAHYRSRAHYYASMIHKRLGLQSLSTSSQERLAEIRRASLAAELHFMYTSETTKTEELFSPEAKVQMGLAKSHLNCATLLHEYAIRYKSVCKELDSVQVLQTLLETSSAATKKEKELVCEYDSVAMIAPTILSSEADVCPKLPNFTRVKVNDLFKQLGPLPHFSSENMWSRPRRVTLMMRQRSYGFSLRGHKPARISGVDEDMPAMLAGVLVGDWVLSINGTNVRYSSHSEMVQLVQSAAGGELVLELTTPTLITSRKLSSNPCSPAPTTPTDHTPFNEESQ